MLVVSSPTPPHGDVFVVWVVMDSRQLWEPRPLGGLTNPRLPLGSALLGKLIHFYHTQRDTHPMVAGDRFVCIATEELHHIVAHFRFAEVGRCPDTREVGDIS